MTTRKYFSIHSDIVSENPVCVVSFELNDEDNQYANIFNNGNIKEISENDFENFKSKDIYSFFA